MNFFQIIFYIFVVLVGIEPTVAVRVAVPITLFIPRLISPIHKGFFSTIVSLFGLEPKTSTLVVLYP